MSDANNFRTGGEKKFSPVQLAVNGGAAAVGSAAAIVSLAGPIWLALGVGVAAGAAGVMLSNEVPKK